MKFHKKIRKNLTAPTLLLIILLTLLILTFEVVFEDKFLPRTYIGDINLTFLTKSQAYQVLDSKFSQRTKKSLTFTYKESIYKINLATASAQIQTIDLINEAFTGGHENSTIKKLASQLKLLFLGYSIKPEVKLNLNDQIEKIAGEVLKEPVDAKLIISGDIATESGQIKIIEDKPGLELNKQVLIKQIENYIVFGELPNLLPVETKNPKITSDKAKRAKEFMEESLTDPVKLIFEKEVWSLDPKTLLTILNLEDEQSLIDKEKLKNYLLDLSQNLDQPVIEGQFNFEPATGKVSQFKPSQEGLELDIEKTSILISLALDGQRAKNITLPVGVTEPKIKTGDVNNLGIRELIGRGISHFSGSIPNRIYNVGLTATRINGVLVPPGEIFSFNQTIGDVSAETGYKQAYVIKSGRTVLDDGGGVCQDSTTLFRAVLNAGLPVVSRTAHAYRVGYYEQGFPPGLDATVFHPTVDFKFKNDTGHHILIQAYVSGSTLYVDLYGTSDKRVSTLSKPIVTSSTPPPPEIRQDDPELPKGTVKQVDFPAWGANVSFNRKVTRGGKTLINETFKSNYKAWAAVYLVGTKEN